MLKHLQAWGRRLAERRHYESLLATLERINAVDVSDMDGAAASHGGAQQVFGGGRR